MGEKNHEILRDKTEKYPQTDRREETKRSLGKAAAGGRDQNAKKQLGKAAVKGR
jgi:hypothetical protein